MVGRSHSQENSWGGGVVDTPITSLPWRDYPMCPAVGERKKDQSAEWEWREGSLRT